MDTASCHCVLSRLIVSMRSSMPVHLYGRPQTTPCSCILSLEIADGMSVGTSVTSNLVQYPRVVLLDGTLALDNKHQQVDAASERRRCQRAKEKPWFGRGVGHDGTVTCNIGDCVLPE